MNILGTELRCTRNDAAHETWEATLTESPRVRMGLACERWGHGTSWRGYVTSDGGPDFWTSLHDTREAAAEDLARCVGTMRAALAKVGA